MKIDLKTAIAAGLMAGFFSLDVTAASALPLLDGKVAVQSEAPTPKIETVRYRCYGCYRRRYVYRPYYRPYYRYGYYRPYYYRPHIGIGIGGIGLGIY